jgi:hypothetical protein
LDAGGATIRNNASFLTSAQVGLSEKRPSSIIVGLKIVTSDSKVIPKPDGPDRKPLWANRASIDTKRLGKATQHGPIIRKKPDGPDRKKSIQGISCGLWGA